MSSCFSSLNTKASRFVALITTWHECPIRLLVWNRAVQFVRELHHAPAIPENEMRLVSFTLTP